MAKKVVANLQKSSSNKKTTKVIRCKKTKRGGYTFKAELVPTDKLEDYLKED